MLKSVFAFLAALSITALLSTGALAQSGDPYALSQQHEWAIGTEIYYYHYEEPNFAQNEGAMYGVSAHYKYKHPERWSAMVEGRGAWGSVDYSSNGTGTAENNSDATYEARLTGGYDFYLNEDWTLTPFFGIGYRYLNDDSEGTVTTTGARGYERISQYLYSPIGLDLEYDSKQGWTVGAIFEFDIFYGGRQESRLGGAVPGLNTLKNDQDSGYGLRGAIPFRRQSGSYVMVFEPYIRWWKIDDSNEVPLTFAGVLVGYGLEPQNETLEAGGRVAILF